MAGNQGNNRIVWQEWQLQFLEDNWQKMTAKAISQALGLSRTIVRMKKYELGYYKMQLEYWTEEQILFLKDNYKTIGDVEIAEKLQEKYPKQKRWDKRHIAKKRKYLDLQRTEEERKLIASKNSSPGGKSYTINKNSSSKNMHPKWVAGMIAWRDKDIQEELVKYPDIINAGRQIILLNREIKKAKKNA